MFFFCIFSCSDNVTVNLRMWGIIFVQELISPRKLFIDSSSALVRLSFFSEIQSDLRRDGECCARKQRAEKIKSSLFLSSSWLTREETCTTHLLLQIIHLDLDCHSSLFFFIHLHFLLYSSWASFILPLLPSLGWNTICYLYKKNSLRHILLWQERKISAICSIPA